MNALSRFLIPLRRSVRHSVTSYKTLRSASKPSKLLVKSALGSDALGPDKFARFLKAAGFCATASGVTYIGCVIWQYENVRNALKSVVPAFSKIFPNQKSSSQWQDKIMGYWTDLNDGKKLIVGLIAINCIVFSLWQLRSLQPVMTKYFLSDPTAKKIGLPTLLSIFSHIAPLHVFCNMYVLWSFADAAIHMFGKEQFLFFYMSAGMFAGILSLMNKLARGVHQPSLGASGAIIGALGAVCTAFPDSKLSIIFLPMYPFSAESALTALLCFESLGVLLKWRFFDHAAHLGGLLFGIWYVKLGHELTWGKRQTVMEWWHKLRGHGGVHE
ncbi:Presenilins-associated rhomboid-like protein, mitochondrial [Hypsibius exemplaris]|uniref:rhomboid protease n=1 Tax=Hypsibius exemplaris TaxID=2072580 RepID=A0A1W0XEP5_HYPEX|nr:Presenilins-associated rhomboid-like protein, mitochondrial [Hypsibius exemplaris]